MHHEKGMTLIEVLLALAIIGIALTAVIHSASQSIQQTVYLQQRTLATWTGLELLREIQTGLRSSLSDGAIAHGESERANQTWSWDITETSSKIPTIKTLHIKVFIEPEQQLRAEITGYLYVPKK